MKYALNLDGDGRVLSVTFPRYAPADAVTVAALPEGDIHAYRYVDGTFVCDPVGEAGTQAPSQLDRLEAQLVYTAMMTDTLLEA